jgi:hypothetical protein
MSIHYIGELKEIKQKLQSKYELFIQVKELKESDFNHQ